VDCSAELTSSSVGKNGTTLIRLFADLAKPYGISIVNNSQAAFDTISGFMLNAGETVHEVIQRMCADRGLLTITDEDGRLVLTNSGSVNTSDPLVYGVNVKSASGRYSDADRYAQYIVKGEGGSGGSGWGASTATLGAEGKATDPKVARHRKKIIKVSESISSTLAQKKASWEAQTRAGRAGELSVTVAGWRQQNGAMWKINQLVPVDIAPLQLVGITLLITEINYSQDSGGTACTLTLKHPNTYTAEPQATVKKTSKSTPWGS
jgi:prophage tail gpP-like protein